jgi:ribosomal protein S18 acetylase RimI-like enzyme
LTDLQANTATLYATIEVARRVERAEIEFCALAGATSASVDVCDVAGGRALFSRAGSPLNKVLGLGLFGPVTDDDLHRLEKFYGTRGVPTQIELCPLAYGDLAARLCARGYVLEAFENELGMLLAAAPDVKLPVTVTRTTSDQDDLWTRVVSEGFVAFEPLVGGAPDAKPLTIEQMIGMMSQFGHPKIDRYLAWVDGEPAGGGAAWAHEGVVGIFGTATLPRFRRRGVQAAITLQAMADARGGADLAIATTAPGSTSQRTFERLGYRVLYTRAVFLKS